MGETNNVPVKMGGVNNERERAYGWDSTVLSSNNLSDWLSL